jgi:putative nucleotide binding protein
MFREDYAIVLDYLPRGYADGFRKEPVAQALGETYFSLLELVPRENTNLLLRERIYIGADKREKIQFIRGRLPYERLTVTGRNELNFIVEELVKRNEAKYIEFFNKAGPISVRQHSLELLPNIGKKHMWDIINQREKKPFENFKDVAARINLMPDPVRVITERIIEELQGESKYHLFIRPPRSEEYQSNR